jgi:uncharacterized membrane protein YccC
MSHKLELRQPNVLAENTIRVSYEAPAVPIAVRLDARAVALEGIMAYLNKASQVRGSSKQLHGNGKLRLQYGQHAAEVQKGAERSRDELLAVFNEGMRTLVAEEALRANGVDEADIEVERISLQANLNRQFGIGHANAGERAKVVRKAKRAARHIIK